MKNILRPHFVVLCLFTNTITLQAQWIQTNGPYNGNVMTFAVSGTNLFAGTPGGGVFLSTNNGTSWSPVSSGLTNTNVLALAVSGTNLFAGTYGGGVFLSTNYGTSWTAVNTGLTNTYVSALAVSGTNLFAGTSGGGVFLSTNNGTSWTPGNSGLINNDVRCLAVSDTNVFAGTVGGGVFRSTTNGTTWTQVNNGLTNITDTGIYALAVSGTNLFAGGSAGVIFLSTNSGTSWSQVSSVLTNTNVIALAVSGTNLFAGTDLGGGVFLSTNSGRSWTAVNSGLTNTNVFTLAVSGTNLFAGTSAGGVFLSTNSGASWSPVSSGLTNTNVLALAVSGTNLFAGTSGGGVFLSTNNGTSWSAVDSGLTNTYVLSLAVSGTNLLAGTRFGGVFLSTNSGTSWSQASSGLTNTYVSAFAVSGTKLFAGTDGNGVFFSTNNGASWTQVNNGLTNTYVSALAISGTNIFVGTESDGVFLSTNNGTSWTQVNNGLNYTNILALAVSGTNLFAGTAGDAVFLSTNNGTSWSQVNTLLSSYVQVLTVSGTNLFAGTSGGVFLSTNTGTSWSQVSTGLTKSDVAALAISGTNLFAGIFADGVWRRPLSEMMQQPPLTPLFGTLLGSFNGVAAYSNGRDSVSNVYNTATGINTGMEWQCVEYVNRYYYVVDGLNIRVEGQNANQYFNNASAHGLVGYASGGLTSPQVGDILCFSGGSDNSGHIAIVRAVTSDSVTVIQQNVTEDYRDTSFSFPLTVGTGTKEINPGSVVRGNSYKTSAITSTTYTVGASPLGGSGSTAYICQGWLRQPPPQLNAISGELEDIVFDPTSGDSTAIPLSSGSKVSLFKGTQSLGTVSPSSNGGFSFSGLDNSQIYDISINASKTLIPSNRIFSLALLQTSITPGSNTNFHIPVSLFGSCYSIADTFLARPKINFDLLLGWVPLTLPLLAGYDTSGASQLLSGWSSINGNYDQIASSLIRLNMAEWQSENYYQDASLMTIETLQSLYPFAQRIVGLSDVAIDISEITKDQLLIDMGRDIADFGLNDISLTLNMIFSRIPQGAQYQASSDQLISRLETAIESGADLSTDVLIQSFLFPAGSDLLLSKVYVPSTQSIFDWAVQQSKSFNFTGSYSPAYSASLSLYQFSHARTLATQNAGIELRSTSDLFNSGSELLGLVATISAGTVVGAPAAAVLSNVSAILQAGSLIEVSIAAVDDFVRLVNISNDLSNTINSIYASNVSAIAFRLSKRAAWGRMSGLSALYQSEHASTTGYNDALNILLADAKTGNRQKVRQDIVTLLSLDSALTSQIRSANLPLEAVAQLGDSTLVQFDSLYTQNINNVFTSSNTRQSTYLNLMAYLMDSSKTSYVDSVKQSATAAINANNSVDSLSNVLLSSVRNVPMPGYIASVSTVAPASVAVNSVFTIKTRFQNYGGTQADNLYAVIYFTGGFSTKTDSVSVGSTSPGNQDSVQFVVTAPATDTVGTYSIIYVGDNASYEPVGGVISAMSLTGVRTVAPTVPISFNLYQSYPNPFNPTTIISYDLPNEEYVTLAVYDILGRRVGTVVNSDQQPGKYKVTFDGHSLSSGVYFYRLTAGSFTSVKKMLLMK